jgi:hypothetical protein
VNEKDDSALLDVLVQVVVIRLAVVRGALEPLLLSAATTGSEEESLLECVALLDSFTVLDDEERGSVVALEVAIPGQTRRSRRPPNDGQPIGGWQMP